MTKRILILLITIILALPTLTGCAPSPFDITKEEKEKFEKAISDEFYPDKTKPDPVIFYVNKNSYRKWCEEGRVDELCLGKYGGYIVFCSPIPGMIPTSVEFYIDKYCFYHVNSIWAYKDGNIKYLHECYDEGAFSDDDVKIIHDTLNKSFNYTPHYLPEQFIISEEEKETFEKDVQNEFGKIDEKFFYIEHDLANWALDDMKQVCYGNFGGYLIFSIADSTEDEKSGFDLDEYHFSEHDGVHVKAYKDGQFVSIEEAYKNGAFSLDDIELFHTIYCRPNWFLDCNHEFIEKGEES